MPEAGQFEAKRGNDQAGKLAFEGSHALVGFRDAPLQLGFVQPGEVLGHGRDVSGEATRGAREVGG